MPRTGWTPSVVRNGADQRTAYLVVDNFGRLGTCYRETDITRSDLETTITDLMSGHSMTRFASSPSTRWSIGRGTSQEISPSKSKAAAISMVGTFRKTFGTSSIATPVQIGSLHCGWRKP